MPETKSSSYGSVFPLDRDSFGGGTTDPYYEFKEDLFENTTTGQQALDWIHNLQLNFSILGADGETSIGPPKPFTKEEYSYPEENHKFAPMLETPVNQHTDNNIHVWPISTFETQSGGTYGDSVRRDDDQRYGMLMVLDLEQNEAIMAHAMDASDEFSLRSEQAEYLGENFRENEGKRYDNGHIIHPKIKNSVMHPEEEHEGDETPTPVEGPGDNTFGAGQEGMEAVEKYWLPTRYDGAEPDMDGLDMRTANINLLRNIRKATVSEHHETYNTPIGEDANVAATPEVINQFSDYVTKPGENGTSFEEFMSFSYDLHQLAEQDGNFVLYNDQETGELNSAEVYDDQTVDNILQAEKGDINFQQTHTLLEPQDTTTAGA